MLTESNYDKFPAVAVSGFASECWSGYEEIAAELNRHDAVVLTVDCYPGVHYDDFLSALVDKWQPQQVICADDIFYDGDVLTEMMQAHLTEDRVRGVMYYGKLEDFVDPTRLVAVQELLANGKRTLIYGVGAALVSRGDFMIYADITRWEIQLRYRKGMANFKQENYDEDILRKYKRGFFIEWRVADKHKRELFAEADYWLDTNTSGKPIMISQAAFSAAMAQTVIQPFRTVPYFDPGVWGGQWMKEVCNLEREVANFAWSFDGVPEENSLLFDFGNCIYQSPAINVVFHEPKALLGNKVYARFGAEFPIRFDFLDTMGGQNLSLQVHPTTDFIKNQYGMSYTQDESYYILDAGDDAQVYLGVKDDVDKEAMLADLSAADRGEQSFDADKYVNMYPAKAHDHFLIPSGTVHCSAADCMVLEISATPYIFTFKLWDWDRVGLDGLPRPIHLQEGAENINWEYNATFAESELINQFSILEDDGLMLSEQTGLQELEFIQTNRYTSSCAILLDTNGGVNMLNLVSGSSAVISSPDDSFAPFIVHYAETFIIPAAVGAYSITPIINGEEIKVIQAFVRG